MTAPHNHIHVPMSEDNWQSEGWRLLECDSDWEEYKTFLDEERFDDRLFGGKRRTHNHGSFHPERYPCLVWSFNTMAAVMQHRFLYPDDAQSLWDALQTTPPPRRERPSDLAEGA